ncbi:MAG: hypothetical protein KF901_21610 [Myxococcales bacterium]|nr:hypothetical protein [Myxococcales bacterium]
MDESTVENRAYLFKDLATAWITAHGALLADPTHRPRALAALADLAFVCCTIADGDDLDATEIAAKIRAGG